MMRFIGILLVLTSPTIVQLGSAATLPLPFGSDTSDTLIFPNDNGANNKVFSLLEPLLYFDDIFTEVAQQTTGPDRYTVFDISHLDVIYMFRSTFTDSFPKRKNEMWARVTNDEADLQRIQKILAPANTSMIPTSAFATTWDQVYEPATGSFENSLFQLIVASNHEDTWVIMAYEKLPSGAWGCAGFLTMGESPFGFCEESHVILDGSKNTGVPGIYAIQVGSEIDVKGCGFWGTTPILSPFFGPSVGGTAIQIQNLPVCLDDDRLKPYCRFEGDNVGTVVTPGFRVLPDIVKCVTPPHFGLTPAYAQVSYAVHDPVNPFDSASANWIHVKRNFVFWDVSCDSVFGTNVKILGGRSARSISWTLVNDGTETVALQGIKVTWPAARGQLRKIKVDGDTLWEGAIEPDSAYIPFTLEDWANRRRHHRVLRHRSRSRGSKSKKGENDNGIKPGQAAELRLEFAEDNGDDGLTDGYKITADFGTCTVSFP